MKHKVSLLALLLSVLCLPQAVQAYDFSATAPSGQTLYYTISYNSVSVVKPSSYSYYNYVSGALTIPDTVTHNGISYAVTSIGFSAFFDCSGLTSVTIPNSVTSIGDRAFEGCSGLTSVTIPNSVTSIGYSAFSGCSGLTSVTIPNSVTSIRYSAFSGCSGLTSVTIPNSVTAIGENAFYNCSGLTSVTIPNSVTYIGSYAFSGCSGLTSVTIPNSVTSIGNSAFSKCSSLTSITIPNSVTSIGRGAFYKCSSLTSITIPNSVTSIGDSTFSGCSGLTSIQIPNSVTSIGGRAFSGCDHLTNITLGCGLQTIGGYAFGGCSQVVRIKSYSTEAPTVQSNTFSDLSDNVVVNVPCGSASVYENAAYWLRFDIQEDLMYSFSVTSGNPSQGTVQVIKQPTCDDAEAVVQAHAYHNYHFVRWSDGNTDSLRYIVVTQDTAIQAEFAEGSGTEGIDNIKDDDILIYSIDGRIHVVVGNHPQDEFRVFDAMGREVFYTTQGDVTPQFPAGVYLVKLKGLPARKVVVIR